jgi:hypothetical protein
MRVDMGEKLDWFPIDSRIFPIDLSFPTPKSRWVRIALLAELFLAFISVVGTLILMTLPPPKIPPSATEASTPKPASTILPGYR